MPTLTFTEDATAALASAASAGNDDESLLSPHSSPRLEDVEPRKMTPEPPCPQKPDKPLKTSIHPDWRCLPFPRPKCVRNDDDEWEWVFYYFYHKKTRAF